VAEQTELEALAADALERAGILFDSEFKFHPTRRWRADFLVYPDVLIEIDGGLNKPNSGHRSYKGVHSDIEKQNEAVAMGYRPVRVTAKDLKGDGRWLQIVRILLGHEPSENLFGPA
jgi:hypothetical protein